MAAATLGACVQIVPCGAPSTLTRRTLALGSAATTPPLPPPLLSQNQSNQVSSFRSCLAQHEFGLYELPRAALLCRPLIA